MLLAGVDVQTLQGILGDDVAGHHAADGHAHSQLGLVLHQDAVLGLLQTAHPTGVGTIVLLLHLVAGEHSLARVDDDDVVTAVGVGGIGNCCSAEPVHSSSATKNLAECSFLEIQQTRLDSVLALI